MNIKNYPMGAAADERLGSKGKVHHIHAVEITEVPNWKPGQGGKFIYKPLCRVKLKSLCLDDSQAEPFPSCPTCQKKVTRLRAAEHDYYMERMGRP